MHWETALITGGSTGIGAALARELRNRGTKVVICARKKEQLEATAKELDAIPLVADMGDPNRAKEVVEEAHRTLGSLDLVIANAGFGGNRPATKLKPEHIISMYQTNVIGACVTIDRKSTRLNSSHLVISYAVFCLKKKKIM